MTPIQTIISPDVELDCVTEFAFAISSSASSISGFGSYNCKHALRLPVTWTFWIVESRPNAHSIFNKIHCKNLKCQKIKNNQKKHENSPFFVWPADIKTQHIKWNGNHDHLQNEIANIDHFHFSAGLKIEMFLREITQIHNCLQEKGTKCDDNGVSASCWNYSHFLDHEAGLIIASYLACLAIELHLPR